jgi:hypothetical protein
MEYVDALQWTGDNLEDVQDFVECAGLTARPVENLLFCESETGRYEDFHLRLGQYVLFDAQGFFRVYPAHVFEQMYEEVQ